jgi:hypothetical protein
MKNDKAFYYEDKFPWCACKVFFKYHCNNKFLSLENYHPEIQTEKDDSYFSDHLTKKYSTAEVLSFLFFSLRSSSDKVKNKGSWIRGQKSSKVKEKIARLIATHALRSVVAQLADFIGRIISTLAWVIGGPSSSNPSVSIFQHTWSFVKRKVRLHRNGFARQSEDWQKVNHYTYEINPLALRRA